MSSDEISDLVLNSPFEEPSRHWYIQEGEERNSDNGV